MQPAQLSVEIERAIAPLLELRADLVLVGDLLLVRPVRHVLRGALLEQRRGPSSFCLVRYMQAMHDVEGRARAMDYIHPGVLKTKDPYFSPLLLDALGEDVFAHFAAGTSLTDFADGVMRSGAYISAWVTALVLAGERERADEFVRGIEQGEAVDDKWKALVARQRAFLARDIGDVCADYHAREAETAKAMKLEAIWEPSPFPVELPAADRVRSAEPGFALVPWIARPASLLEHVAEQAGEVRFAVDHFVRNDNVILVGPLSRADAEARDRRNEGYVAAARLEDGPVMVAQVIRRSDDGHAAPQASGPPDSRLILDVYGARRSVLACFDVAARSERPLLLADVMVRERGSGAAWLWNVSLSANAVHIRDGRGAAGLVKSERPLTDADRDLLSCQCLAFGEFAEAWTCVRSLLEREGAGDLM